LLYTNVTTATSDQFRAEFLQTGIFAFGGPQVIKLEAFGAA